jgi:site-specific recombinase XerD
MMNDPDIGAKTAVQLYYVGPLASHIDAFAARLGGEGYTSKTVHDKCELVAKLSAWLHRRDLSQDALDEGQLDHFHTDRRRQGHVRRGEVATGRQLLRFLRDLGCIQALPPRTDPTPVGNLTRDFGRHLSSERGLSQATLDNYLPIVRRFLIERFEGKSIQFDELCPVDIHRFIVRHAQTGSRRSAQLIVTALRSFLRFLRQRGAIAMDLAGGVPGIANWRLSHLPKSLPPEQVERMLASCDRGTPVGERDYAILLLLARLGLRAGEVVALTLDDLIWERGEILVRGKGQRLGRLPLTTDVGLALVDYLRHVRPLCSMRQVFIRMRAPLRGLVGPTAIDCVVRRALKRAGLNPSFKGAHLLRHSLATDLLRRGASLTEIGQLLRHSQPTTTQIYAKVDIAALRTIGLAWPGVAS